MTSTSTAISPSREPERVGKRRILLVDDDEALSEFFANALAASNYSVQRAKNGREAVGLLKADSFDVVVSDVSMPEMTGVELLHTIREHDLDVPVVLITGAPDVASAARAVEYGAFRYLEKPVSAKVLRDVVRRAMHTHELARIKRRAMALFRDHANAASDRAGLMTTFTRILDTLCVHFQPIIQRSTRSVFAYEALVRSNSRALPHPMALLEAGERLGRIRELGRIIRERVAHVIPSVARDQLIFVNLHPLELADEELLSPQAPLSAFAPRVVLEVTERAGLEEVTTLDERISALRSLGYRLAIDDLGSGYAGLTSFVRLNPEFVKIDMTLIRDVHRSQTKRVLVRSTLELCREMSIRAIVEGVESMDELRELSSIGADLLQGYLFGRPSKVLSAVDFESLSL